MVNLRKVSDLLNIEYIIERLTHEERETMFLSVDELIPLYPFNEYEFVISNLLWRWKMDLVEYNEMREKYYEKNIHLDKFQMAWKSVWKWAEDLMIEWNYDLKKPSRRIDPNYTQQTSYDAYMKYEEWIIRVEIKASRVSDSSSHEEALVDKALFSTDDKPFWMNFQQLKPQLCDVFIFIAIYRDSLTYWVLSSNEVKNYWNEKGQRWRFSQWQHSWNAWNEWQLHIKNVNISDFDKYLAEKNNIKEKIVCAFLRNVT